MEDSNHLESSLSVHVRRHVFSCLALILVLDVKYSNNFDKRYKNVFLKNSVTSSQVIINYLYCIYHKYSNTFLTILQILEKKMKKKIKVNNNNKTNKQTKPPNLTVLLVDVSKLCWISDKQCRPRSDAAFCGVWSGSTLFSRYLWCIRYILLILLIFTSSRSHLFICWTLSLQTLKQKQKYETLEMGFYCIHG